MWKISSINNATHEVSMRHLDGEVMSLVVPLEHAINPFAKTAWLKAQTDARDVVKDAEAAAKAEILRIEQEAIEKAKAELSKLKKRHPAMYILMAVETIAILILLLHGHI